MRFLARLSTKNRLLGLPQRVPHRNKPRERRRSPNLRSARAAACTYMSSRGSLSDLAPSGKI